MLDKLNYLNVALMLLSLIGAYFYPFELFLVSFIFLGPLHYLTEISWLERKDFFIVKKSNAVILLFIVIILIVFYLFPNPKYNDIYNSLLFCTLILAFCMAFTAHFGYLFLSFVFSFAVVYFFKWYQKDWFLIIFTVFLPTIVHITIFTGFFILSGIIKNKNLSGWISLVCFLICTFFFFVIPFHNTSYQASQYVQSVYFDFIVLNKKFSDFFHFGQINKLEDIFQSKEGIIIMQFIAFSYTYHYLNWFTKTSVIKWHEISTIRFVSIGLVYIAVLGFYFINKTTGVALLTLLSLVHLVFEFPLNALSFNNIFLTSKK